ncbi:hypothetical protein FRC04_005683, partial [Tulasnella sp. 424]
MRQIPRDTNPFPLFFEDSARGTLIRARSLREEDVRFNDAQTRALNQKQSSGIWFRPDSEVCNALKSVERDMLDALERIRRGEEKSDDAAVAGYLLQVLEHYLSILVEESGKTTQDQTFYDPIHLTDVTEVHMRNAVENKRQGRSYKCGAWTLEDQISLGLDGRQKYQSYSSERDRRKRKEAAESDSEMSISEDDADVGLVKLDKGQDLERELGNGTKRRKPDKEHESTARQIPWAGGAGSNSSHLQMGTRAWKQQNALKLLTTRGIHFALSKRGSAPPSRGTPKLSIRRKMESQSTGSSNAFTIEHQRSVDSVHAGGTQSLRKEKTADGVGVSASSSVVFERSEASVSFYQSSSPERAEQTPDSGSSSTRDYSCSSDDESAEEGQEEAVEDSWEVYLMGEGGTVFRLLGSGDSLDGAGVGVNLDKALSNIVWTRFVFVLHELPRATSASRHQASQRPMGDVQLDEDCFILPFQPNDDPTSYVDIIVSSHPSNDIRQGPELRKKAFDATWNKVQLRIHDIIRQFSTTLSTSLAEFIHEAYDYAKFGPPPRPTLPTAAVVGGSSNSRSVILDEAFALYRNRESNLLYVSHLHARDCANLTSAMRCLILGFVGQVAADEDEDDLNGVGGSRSGGPALANYDINLLEAWYRPFAKRRSPPKLVVVISDFEAFDTEVLEGLLYICSRHATTLPLVFIFGISTSSSYVQESLSFKTQTCLELNSFAAAGGQELFQSVMEAIFFSSGFDSGVILSPEALESLARTYESFGSFDLVQSAIQLLLLRHFSNPLSVLTTNSPPSSSITPGFRAHLRSKLASGIDRFITLQLSGEQSEIQASAVEAVMSAKDDAGLIRAVNSLRDVFARRSRAQKVFLPLVKILQDFVSGRGLKASLMEVFVGVGDVERYLEVVGAKIRRRSSSDLFDLLNQVLEYFDHLQEEDTQEDVQTLRKELEDLIPQLEHEIDEAEQEQGAPSKAHSLQRSLMKSSASTFADQVFDLLASFVRNHLYPFDCVPLHEAWYVKADGAGSIKE